MDTDEAAQKAYLIDKKDGRLVISSDFVFSWELYKKTGNLIFLAYAFLDCQRSNCDFPDYLIEELNKVFINLINADSKVEALTVMGFDSNKKGGTWQGKIARGIANYEAIYRLLLDFEFFSQGKTNWKEKAFKEVARTYKTSPKYVKKIYYACKKRDRKDKVNN